MRVILFAIPLLGACALSVDDLDGDGFSALEGDCDDLNPTTNPSAEDDVGDGIDQNCDGFDPLMRASGTDHTCILVPSGAITCTGDNSHGQLESPERGGFVQIAAGDFHTCALDAMGNVSCWGDNRWGQSEPPVEGPFIDIDAGSVYSIAVFVPLLHRPALCWGLCTGGPRSP